MLLCGCVNAANISGARDTIEGSSGFDILEVRLDKFEDPKEGIRLIGELDYPVIATFRRSSDGGRDIEESIRKKMLMDAITAGAAYVDLESDLDDKVFSLLSSHASDHGCKVICSFHDFSGTPDHSKLSSIAQLVLKRGDIGKIVTTADSIDDCHRVLGLIPGRSNLIAFCMGSRHRFTRVVSLIYGSPVSYCRLGNPLGAGQFSPTEMRGLLDGLML